jgi:hypothetical protein
MLKPPDSVKRLEGRAADALKTLLAEVPVIKLKDMALAAGGPGREIDILAHIEMSGRRHALVCEVKANGQPRFARMALLQLRNYVAHHGSHATPVFIAPYLSPEVQEMCREAGVGFLDLEGNARLVFNGVFIERQRSTKPLVTRRELKSLFKPKSARVLRVLLRDPQRAWRVVELAAAADVSLGQVSNVRNGLVDREWAQITEEGLRLSEPDALIDAWREVYQPQGNRLVFYTTLHGGAFEEAARRSLGVDREKGQAVFSSFSAAHWLAPYGRTGTQYFYADEVGLERLRAALKLASAAKGENVVVTLPKDDGLFRDSIEPASGSFCTSLVQTYLDLAFSGERGREAADHLRQTKLTWQN